MIWIQLLNWRRAVGRVQQQQWQVSAVNPAARGRSCWTTLDKKGGRVVCCGVAEMGDVVYCMGLRETKIHNGCICTLLPAWTQVTMAASLPVNSTASTVLSGLQLTILGC